MKKNQKKNDELLNRKARDIAKYIEDILYASQENAIEIDSVGFKLMCGYNKYLEQKVKKYIVEKSNLKLMKKELEYYLLGGIIKFRKKKYIVKY